MDEADLEFDTSGLEGRDESYSSLTDTNDISVFTDEFEEDVSEVIQKENEKAERLYNQLFLYEMKEKKTDTVIVQGLFQTETQQAVREEAISESKNGAGLMLLGILILIFMWIMTKYIGMRKQKREDIKNSMKKIA